MQTEDSGENTRDESEVDSETTAIDREICWHASDAKSRDTFKPCCMREEFRDSQGLVECAILYYLWSEGGKGEQAIYLQTSKLHFHWGNLDSFNTQKHGWYIALEWCIGRQWSSFYSALILNRMWVTISPASPHLHHLKYSNLQFQRGCLATNYLKNKSS